MCPADEAIGGQFQPLAKAQVERLAARPAKAFAHLGAVRRMALVVVAALFAGCGNGIDATSSQVVAKVNKDEISVHQVNFVLQQQGGVPADQADAMRRQIAERLIDRQLAVQRAEALDLEKDPKVLMALESARLDTIARAYAERLAGSVASPTPDEIKRYYTENPHLFRDRRVYQLQELLVGAPEERADEVVAAMRSAADVSAMVEWLRRNNVKFSGQQATRAAEQLPLGELKELAALRAGQALVRRTPAGVQVVVVAGSRPEPVDEAAATGAIERYLVNERKRGILERDRASLRSSAHIVYADGYQPPEPRPVPVPAPAADPVSSDADPGLHPDALRNGLKGLK